MDHNALIDNLYEEVSDKPAVPWVRYGVCLLIGYAFLPIGLGLGVARIGLGARAFAPSVFPRLLFAGVATWAFTHVFLVWPLREFILSKYPDRSHRAARLFLSVAFLLPPVLSLAYYIGTHREWMEWHETFWMILPGIVLAALLHEDSGRSWAFSLFLAVAVFTPLFLMNDLLSPFPVLFAYSSTGPTLYFWRSASAVAALAAGFSLKRFRSDSRELLKFASWGLGALLVYGVCLRASVSAISRLVGSEVVQAFRFDPRWLGYLGLIYFLRQRRAITYWLILAVVAVEMALVCASLVMTFRGMRFNFDWLAHIAFQLSSVGLFLAIGWILVTPGVRSLFRNSRPIEG